jgi:peroxiredoxin
MKRMIHTATVCFVCILLAGQSASAVSQSMSSAIYDVGTLKPIDSILNVRVGEKAPDFTLNAISGGVVSLSDYRGKQNVVISFVPAAWTPVCSDQWPGYNIAQDLFKKNNAILLGISVDNVPTLHAWTQQMGTLWFPVLSDFWPHGGVAKKFGVLRSNGTSERAIFIIDKKGIIRYIDVHNINKRPPLEEIVRELEKIR